MPSLGRVALAMRQQTAALKFSLRVALVSSFSTTMSQRAPILKLEANSDCRSWKSQICCQTLTSRKLGPLRGFDFTICILSFAYIASMNPTIGKDGVHAEMGLYDLMRQREDINCQFGKRGHHVIQPGQRAEWVASLL